VGKGVSDIRMAAVGKNYQFSILNSQLYKNPGNPLNYNKYSYVLNNPLKYTDPSGYSAELNSWDDVSQLINNIWDRTPQNKVGQWDINSGFNLYDTPFDAYMAGAVFPQVIRGSGRNETKRWRPSTKAGSIVARALSGMGLGQYYGGQLYANDNRGNNFYGTFSYNVSTSVTPHIILNMGSEGIIYGGDAYPDSDIDDLLSFPITASYVDESGLSFELFSNLHFVTSLHFYNLNNATTNNTIPGNTYILTSERIRSGKLHSNAPSELKSLYNNGALEVIKGNSWIKIHYMQTVSNSLGCWGIIENINLNSNSGYHELSSPADYLELILFKYYELFNTNPASFIKIITPTIRTIR